LPSNTLVVMPSTRHSPLPEFRLPYHSQAAHLDKVREDKRLADQAKQEEHMRQVEEQKKKNADQVRVCVCVVGCVWLPEMPSMRHPSRATNPSHPPFNPTQAAKIREAKRKHEQEAADLKNKRLEDRRKRREAAASDRESRKAERAARVAEADMLADALLSGGDVDVSKLGIGTGDTDGGGRSGRRGARGRRARTRDTTKANDAADDFFGETEVDALNSDTAREISLRKQQERAAIATAKRAKEEEEKKRRHNQAEADILAKKEAAEAARKREREVDEEHRKIMSGEIEVKLHGVVENEPEKTRDTEPTPAADASADNGRADRKARAENLRLDRLAAMEKEENERKQKDEERRRAREEREREGGLSLAQVGARGCVSSCRAWETGCVVSAPDVKPCHPPTHTRTHAHTHTGGRRETEKTCREGIEEKGKAWWE